MPADPIRYFDRYDRTIKTEKIFGEKWLRFAYENPAGRFLTWLIIRRKLFSWYYGWKMNSPASANRVIPFISEYNVDTTEFAKSPFDYKTFNQFFHRALKPESRPIAAGEDVAVFPADGRHLAFQNLDTAEGYYVKGAKFSLEELLGDSALAGQFAGGSMLISRLCPTDYHRFHFPVSGVPTEAKLIKGTLYSVNPIALRRCIRYLVLNKRFITQIESPAFGTVLTLEVGATNVGSVVQDYEPVQPVAKGREKGMFAFGGSCVITLFAKSRIRLDADILAQSALFVETYARMGDHLGVGRR